MSLSPVRTKSTKSKRSGYSELKSNWNFKDSKKPISKKRLVIGWSLIFLAFIFLIGNYNGIIHVVNANPDFNAPFKHTRSPLFTDTSIITPNQGIKVSNTGINSPVGCVATESINFVSVEQSDTLVVFAFRFGAGGSPGITDTQGNFYTNRVQSNTGSGSGESVAILTTSLKTGGSNTVTLNWSGCTYLIVHEYHGVTSFGNSASDQADNVGTSGTSTLTFSVSQNSAIVETFTMDDNSGQPNPSYTLSALDSQTIRQSVNPTNAGLCCNGKAVVSMDKLGLSSGSQTVRGSWTSTGTSPTGNSKNHLALELQTNTLSDFSKVRWSYNSSCVTPTSAGTFPQAWTFDYSIGSSGTGGNNCSSADIMLSKAPVNLQAVSERMLEIIQSWSNTEANIVTFRTQNVSIFLRNNSTLPKFTENYNPAKDPTVRLIWSISPSYNRNQSNVYVVHDPAKSLVQEAPANDLVISGPASQLNALTNVEFQTVLNFSGPGNYLNELAVSGFNSTINQNLVSGFQFGTDFYIGVQTMFETSRTPCSCSASWNIGTQFFAPGLGVPAAFGIFSDPASCSDPVNSATCSNTPTYGFSPLDPSSWGNAIIRGIAWTLLVAVPSGFSIFVNSFLQVIALILNFIGQKFGWGNIGDNVVSFLNGVGNLFITSFSSAISFLTVVVSRGIQTFLAISAIFGSQNVFVGDIFTAAVNVFGFFLTLGTKLIFVGPNAYIMIDLIFYFIFTSSDGLGGFGLWIKWNKYVGLVIINTAEKALNSMISLINWVISKIPSLAGDHLPFLPGPDSGEAPDLRVDFNFPAIRSGDPIVMFFLMIGFVFSLLWMGSSTGPLSSSQFAVIRGQLGSVGFQNLFFPLFSMVFLIMLSTLPMRLIGAISSIGTSSERGTLEGN